MIDTLEFHRQALMLAINCNEPPRPPRLPLDRYLAASLLQKAIRRGEAEWAAIAAHRLLDIDPAHLWRRLIITLFEDIGLHNLALGWRLMAAQRHCRRLAAGDAWRIVSLIVQEMAESEKSQAANNALFLGSVHPEETQSHKQLPDWPLDRVMRWAAARERSIPQRVNALWVISGLKLGGMNGPPAHPEASAVSGWRLFSELVPEPELREIAYVGAQAGASILAISACLIASQARSNTTGSVSAPDYMPPSSSVGEVPSWTFDIYTRLGRNALQRASKSCTAVRAVLDRHGVPNAVRTTVLGGVHFEFESACLRARIQNPFDIALLARARASAAAPWFDASIGLFDALQADWKQFQNLRVHSHMSGEG